MEASELQEMQREAQVLGYHGRLYKITSLHKQYFKSLAHIASNQYVTLREWAGQAAQDGVQTNVGTSPKAISPTMLYGVFAVRRFINLDRSGGKLRVRLTQRGHQFSQQLAP